MRRDNTRPYRSTSGKLYRLTPPAGTMAHCPRAYAPPAVGEVLQDIITNATYRVIWAAPCYGPRGGLKYTFVELSRLPQEQQQ